LINPALEHAKKELILFNKINRAPVAEFDLFSSSFLIPSPTTILEEHAAK
jgi:hypothetical protein